MEIQPLKVSKQLKFHFNLFFHYIKMTDNLIPVFTYLIQPILTESFRWTEKYVGYKTHMKFTLRQCFSNQGDILPLGTITNFQRQVF